MRVEIYVGYGQIFFFLNNVNILILQSLCSALYPMNILREMHLNVKNLGVRVQGIY